MLNLSSCFESALALSRTNAHQSIIPSSANKTRPSPPATASQLAESPSVATESCAASNALVVTGLDVPRARGDLVMCGPISRANFVDITHLRTDARRCFARAGIHHRYVDTAVVTCLIAANTRQLVSPFNYCVAIGRRLQDESTTRSSVGVSFRVASPTRALTDRMSKLARTARRIEHELSSIFPNLSRYLPASRRVGGATAHRGTRTLCSRRWEFELATSASRTMLGGF